jgi:hypothetical protein
MELGMGTPGCEGGGRESEMEAGLRVDVGVRTMAP